MNTKSGAPDAGRAAFLFGFEIVNFFNNVGGYLFLSM